MPSTLIGRETLEASSGIVLVLMERCRAVDKFSEDWKKSIDAIGS